MEELSPLLRLGQGGMAEVVLAVRRRSGLEKLVVAKVLKSDLATHPDHVTMFRDEARLSTLLRHPNVVEVFDVTELDGRPAILMQYLEGRTFSQLRKRLGPQELGLQVAVVAEALRGLHYAHGAEDMHGDPLGIVHRDFTPNNIFVPFEGPIKVLDFGIARSEARETVTRTDVVKGTLRYLAPEQLQGAPVTPRTDVFATGVMLWETVTGKSLYQGESEASILYKVAHSTLPPPAFAAEHPGRDALVEIIVSASATLPENRYESAAALADVLDAWLRTYEPERPRERTAALMREHFGEEHDVLRGWVRDALRNDLSVSWGSTQTADEVTSTYQSDAGTVASKPSAIAQQTPTPELRRGGPRRPVLFAVVAGVTLVAATLFVLRPSAPSAPDGADAEVPPPAATSPTMAPSAVQRDAPQPAEVTVAVFPSAAHLELAGEQVQGPILRVPVPPGETRRLVARLEGYESETIELDGTEGQLSLTLEETPPRAEAQRATTMRSTASRVRRLPEVPGEARDGNAVQHDSLEEPAGPAEMRPAEPMRGGLTLDREIDL